MSGEDAAPTDRSQPEFDFDDGAQAPAEDRKPRPSRQKAAVAEPASAEPEDQDAQQDTAEQDASRPNRVATTSAATSALTADAPLAGREVDDGNINPPAGADDQAVAEQAPLASASHLIGEPSEYGSGTETGIVASTPPSRLVPMQQDPMLDGPGDAERPQAVPHIAAMNGADQVPEPALAHERPHAATTPPAASTADAGTAVPRGLFDAATLPVRQASPADAAADVVEGQDPDAPAAVEDTEGTATRRA
ncbi:hypothetical protein BH23PSE2_BH23PSE2_04720 [soil metagenome]